MKTTAYKTRVLLTAGLMACLAASAWACDWQPPQASPTPAPQASPTPAPQAQPAPVQQPAAEPGGGGKAFKPDEGKAAPEEASCLGPDGKQHKFPLHVYDENADGSKTIRDGIAKAKSEHKRVLAMWGENMCQFCIWLEDILERDPGCSPIVKSDYVWVRIDLGRGYSKGDIKNLELAKFYGLTHLQEARPDGKTMGAPSLCIIDPETGSTVGIMDSAHQELTGVMGGNDMVPKEGMRMNRLFDEKVIQTYLITWRPPAKPAQGAMNDAIVAAKRDSEKILALFTMPNDEACEKASNWMSRPDAAAALGNSFVTVKIDTERMIGGREMLAAAAGRPVLPPFLCVLDEAGKPVGGTATQFTALPRTDAEIDAFIKGLNTAAKVGEADKAVLIRSLKDAAIAQAEPKKP